MKILTNQVFLDDVDRYEENTEYDVPLEKGIYFVRNGWAEAAEALQDEVDDNNIDLNIHKYTIGMKDSNG